MFAMNWWICGFANI